MTTREYVCMSSPPRRPNDVRVVGFYSLGCTRPLSVSGLEAKSDIARRGCGNSGAVGLTRCGPCVLQQMSEPCMPQTVSHVIGAPWGVQTVDSRW
jgi:hypothetical protein